MQKKRTAPRAANAATPQAGSRARVDLGRRANGLPVPPHGDSLREELADLLGMLLHLQELIPQRRPEAAMQQAADCYALLLSILDGKPSN